MAQQPPSRALEEDEIIVTVPSGAAEKVYIQEATEDPIADITVTVSERKRPSDLPMLGFLVK